MLDGVFAFVLYDTRNKTFMAARDAIGVNPLYIGWGGDGRRLLSSILAHLCFAPSASRFCFQAKSG
jgi:asparagine synthetase B (glutamine-hydrolysing)